MRSPSGVFVGLSVVVACLLGCTRPATQLVVVVESDYDVGTGAPDALAELLVTTTPLGSGPGPEDPARFVLGSSGLPLSFGVVPPRGAEGRVEIEIVARDASGAVRATQRVRTGFLDGRALRLPVFLARRCERVVCDPDQRCDPSGVCVDGLVDERTLEPVTPGTELRDAGPPPIDAAAAPLAEPTRAEAHAHTVGTDVRGLVRLLDGTLVVTSQTASGGVIGAYSADGNTLLRRVTITGGAPRPVVTASGFALNVTRSDTPVDIDADRVLTIARPAELAPGSVVRAIVGLTPDASVAWDQTLWSRPDLAGDPTGVWCQLCGRGEQAILACSDLGGGTLMLDDAPVSLGPPLSGELTARRGALIRARVGATGLEGLQLVRWFGDSHDAYCAFDDEGGFYAAFRHTDVLRGLDRDRDPSGADTLTVARFASDGSLRWTETILSVSRSVTTPSAGYPGCYSNLTATVAPSGFFVATWFPTSSSDCLRVLSNGSGVIARDWASYPLVTATLGPEGQVGADRMHLAELGGVAWSLTTHPSGTVLLAAHVDATATNGDVLGVPVAVAGASDGILLALDPLGAATWAIRDTSDAAGSSDAFLGVTTEPSGAIWVAALHTAGTGSIFGTSLPGRALVRLE